MSNKFEMVLGSYESSNGKFYSVIGCDTFAIIGWTALQLVSLYHVNSLSVLTTIQEIMHLKLKSCLNLNFIR